MQNIHISREFPADVSLKDLQPRALAGFNIIPTSLGIERADGSLLENDKDYKLDSHSDSIERTASSTAGEREGETVTLHYKIKRRRLDTLIVNRDGKFALLQGIASQFAPSPAEAPASAIAVAHVMTTSGSEPLTDDLMLPIGDSTLSNPSPDLISLNAQALVKAKDKLKQKKNLHILVCGDSVACGAFADKPESSYPEVFRKHV